MGLEEGSRGGAGARRGPLRALGRVGVRRGLAGPGRLEAFARQVRKILKTTEPWQQPTQRPEATSTHSTTALLNLPALGLEVVSALQAAWTRPSEPVYLGVGGGGLASKEGKGSSLGTGSPLQFGGVGCMCAPPHVFVRGAAVWISLFVNALLNSFRRTAAVESVCAKVFFCPKPELFPCGRLGDKKVQFTAGSVN